MRTALSPTCASGGRGKGPRARHDRRDERTAGECKGSAGHHVPPIVVSQFLSGNRALPVERIDLVGASSPSADSKARVCSPSRGGSSRTPRREPAIVNGSSVVLTVSPALSPSGRRTSASPPVALRCGSS